MGEALSAGLDRELSRVLLAQWLRARRLVTRTVAAQPPEGLWMKCFPTESAGQASRRVVTTSGDGALPGALGEAGGVACDVTPSTESSLGDLPPRPHRVPFHGRSRLVPALLCLQGGHRVTVTVPPKGPAGSLKRPRCTLDSAHSRGPFVTDIWVSQRALEMPPHVCEVTSGSHNHLVLIMFLNVWSQRH